VALSQGTLALVVTLGMSLVPSVLFLGLWHGLRRLRDDRLVDDVLTRAESAEPTTVEPHAYLGAGDPAASGDEPTAAREAGLELCPECRVLRPPNGESCPGCGVEPGSASRS
jgi:hypothetical protein